MRVNGFDFPMPSWFGFRKVKPLSLVGFRTHHTKVGYPDILNIYKLKDFEKWKMQGGLSNLPLKQVIIPP